MASTTRRTSRVPTASASRTSLATTTAPPSRVGRASTSSTSPSERARVETASPASRAARSSSSRAVATPSVLPSGPTRPRSTSLSTVSSVEPFGPQDGRWQAGQQVRLLGQRLTQGVPGRTRRGAAR